MQQTIQVIKQVKKIEITTKYLVDGLIAGNYHSVFKGSGIEFSQIREYQPGDDIRSIDWNVTARFNHPYVKEFIEERDLRVYFAFDMSGSGNFGNKIVKRTKAIELTASLMFSALRNNDNVGLFLFTDHIETFIPARKGRKHVLKLISSLVSHEPTSKQTDLKKALIFISNVMKKRSLLFIISDFYSDDFLEPLKILKNRHDIVAVKITDTREKILPDVGLIELEDEETQEQILIDTSDKEFRDNFAKIMQKEEERLRNLFRKYHIDIIEVVTDEPYEQPLKKFFYARKRQVIR
ncbi:MAG: DUF58 domain-containing protein [Methanosarcinales archaeon]|nr:DUF58 domain-containing protein [Methanosarcinales archaeon]